jgi:hypothetical protein
VVLRRCSFCAARQVQCSWYRITGGVFHRRCSAALVTQLFEPGVGLR